MPLNLDYIRKNGKNQRTTFRFPDEQGRMWKTSVQALADYTEEAETEALAKAEGVTLSTTERKDIEAPFSLDPDKRVKAVKRSATLTGKEVSGFWAELKPVSPEMADELEAEHKAKTKAERKAKAKAENRVSQPEPLPEPSGNGTTI